MRRIIADDTPEPSWCSTGRYSATTETVATEGPGARAARSLPMPAKTERVPTMRVRAGTRLCRLPGPSQFSRVAERPRSAAARPRRANQLPEPETTRPSAVADGSALLALAEWTERRLSPG